ncbi:MAG: hypothetical protein RIC95_12680 [Vicingaceae bacterium]
MKLNLLSQYPWWMFVFCALLGALYAVVLYRKDRKLNEFSKPLIFLLAFLRGALVTFLAALLLAPLIKYQSKKVEKPKIVIAQDVSESIVLNKDSSYYRDTLPQEIDALKSKLSKDHEVYHYHFDEKLSKADTLPTYQGQLTAFDELFEGVEERYANRNFGALILLSDGIYNQGSNPLYQKSSERFPIYTVALGDTAIRRDLKVETVLHNEVAYLGNDFPVEIEILANKAKGQNSVVKLLRNGKTLWSENIKLKKEQEVVKLRTEVEAKQVGVQRYELIVEPLNKELNQKNNRKSFYLDVLDGRQKILIIADAPHPDIAALKTSLSKNKNYEVESTLASDFKGDVKNYNLLILHQLPSNRHKVESLLAAAKDNRISTWYIVGQKSKVALYSKQETALNLKTQMREFNEVLPLYHTAFPLFNLTEKQQKEFKAYPPLRLPFGEYKLASQAYPLLKQKIGSVNTEAPLLAFRELEGRKTATLVGEGLWRWRIANYAAFQSHNSFDELISKTVQYLALKADKSYFRLSHKKRFLENEKVEFEAQLYNKSYELVNDPEVNILLTDQNGKEYPYLFSRSQNAYFLNLASLPVGNYRYTASTVLGGKEYQEVGEFSVEKIQLEAAQTVADHNLLYRLAKESGGELVYPKQLSTLVEKLNQRSDIVSISYAEDKIEEVIKLKWIFFILLALLSLEWFLRKRNGAY